MKRTICFTVIFMLAMLFTSCQDAVVFEPEPVKLEKNNTGVFRLYQDFYNVPVEWQVNGTQIKVSFTNRRLFDISSHLFVVIKYQSYSLMLYLNKPSAMSFTIPYYGTDDIEEVIIYAILTR